MSDVVTMILILIGASFLFLGALGLARMPDLFSRMQAATKASTLGIACVLLAVAVHFQGLGITTRALATIMFFLLTAPVSAHIIARASYFVGVPLWEHTIIDELHGRYDPGTHKLDSCPTMVYENEPVWDGYETDAR